jgi:hypothetical protein
MPRDDFQQLIEHQLETASARLVAEGRQAQNG